MVLPMPFQPFVPELNSLAWPDETSQQLRFAVIGGGISGLTAAYRLTKLLPQSSVEVFEATNQLGGVLSTLKQDELLIERGADSFLAKQPWAVELCEELGLAEELIPTNTATSTGTRASRRRTLSRARGVLYDATPAGAADLAKSLLSWSGKLRLLAERLIPRPKEIETTSL